MHKLSSIISKPIFSLFEGVLLGTVLDICFINGKFKGFFILSSDEENISFLDKKDVYGIEEVIVVKNIAKLSFAGYESSNVMNKRAITLSGQDLGRINEVFLDDNFNILSVQTDSNLLLPNEKISKVGEDAVVFEFGEKVKISSFKPKGKIFSGEVKDLKVTILEKEKENASKLLVIGENENVEKKHFIPKKIMQNPNFLLGRRAAAMIKAESGEVIIGAGQIITEKTISRAKIHNKIFELSSCAN